MDSISTECTVSRICWSVKPDAVPFTSTVIGGSVSGSFVCRYFAKLVRSRLLDPYPYRHIENSSVRLKCHRGNEAVWCSWRNFCEERCGSVYVEIWSW